MFLPSEKLACFKIWVVFGSYFPANMFLFKSLPQGLFKGISLLRLISRCYHAAGLGLQDTVKCPPGRRKIRQSTNNGDREQTSNSERTEVKWRFSDLLSDGSQICLKTSEITSTNFAILNDRKCRWVQIWRTCSYYEFARECKFIRYFINQNTTLNLLLKDRIKTSPLKLQTATPRMHFASTERYKRARQKRHRQNHYPKEFSMPA